MRVKKAYICAFWLVARRAVKGTSFAALADQMTGPLVYASEDRLLRQGIASILEKDDKIVLKAGSYNGDLLSQAQVAELASIPSEELLAKLLGVMQAPVSGFARALAALAAKQAETSSDQFCINHFRYLLIPIFRSF